MHTAFDIPINGLPTPCFIVDERKIRHNLEILQNVQEKTSARILLAMKAFSMYALFPMIGSFLAGTTASGLYEARLGHEEMGKEVHTYAPAFSDKEFPEILRYSDHIVFNSFSQWERFRPAVESYPVRRQTGLRINPGWSEVEPLIYNPCAPGSRLGILRDEMEKHEKDLDGIDGLHFHTLCEQDSDALWKTVQIVDRDFEPFIRRMKWINFGGGHHITRDGYDIPTLIRSIEFIQQKYGIPVYLEPGEAVALNAGYLVSRVLDITENDGFNAILDTSAACHMPDVLEMPYRPPVIGGYEPGEKPFTYRFGGPTCLSGDVIGTYSFDHELKTGDPVIFGDMAIYSMVKTNTFNGMPLPAIAVYSEQDGLKIWKTFGYEDFKQRL